MGAKREINSLDVALSYVQREAIRRVNTQFKYQVMPDSIDEDKASLHSSETISNGRSAFHIGIFWWAALSMLIFNAANIELLGCFSFTMPAVDVVQMLQEYYMRPSPYQTHEVMISDILKEIYFRNEDVYLKNINTSSIIVQPSLQVGPSKIALKLQDGLYNHHPTTKGYSFPVVQISNSISELRRDSFSEGRAFIRKFVWPFDRYSSFDFTDVPRKFGYLNKTNWGIFGISCVLLALTGLNFSKISCKNWERLALFCGSILSALSLSALQMYNIFLLVPLDVQLPTIKIHCTIFQYVLQLLITLAVLIFHVLNSWKIVKSMIHEREIRKICTHFQPSRTPSSVYSPDPIDLKGTIYLPSKRPILSPLLSTSPRAESFKFKCPSFQSSPGDTGTCQASQPNMDAYEPVSGASKISSEAKINRQKEINSMIPIGSAKLRPAPRTGVFQLDSISPNESRSFSAPIFQHQGTASTLASQQIIPNSKTSAEEPDSSTRSPLPTTIEELETEQTSLNVQREIESTQHVAPSPVVAKDVH